MSSPEHWSHTIFQTVPDHWCYNSDWHVSVYGLMNSKKPKLSNKQRKIAYTYFVIRLTNGNAECFVVTEYGKTGHKASAYRFHTKKQAKNILWHMMRSRMPAFVALRSNYKFNIIKHRGVSKREEFLDDLVNL